MELLLSRLQVELITVLTMSEGVHLERTRPFMQNNIAEQRFSGVSESL